MLGELFRSEQPARNVVQSKEMGIPHTLDPSRIPQHIAVIMDGNGRWAKRRALPRFAGHRAGIESLRELTRNCLDLKIKILTVFAFSTENWSRPREEVNFLIKLLDEVLDKESAELHANGARIRIIGRRTSLPESLARKIESVEELTKDNDRLMLNVGFNYGGRAEIVDATKRLVQQARLGKINEDDITEALLAQSMYTEELPDPDLLIRTGGEWRISNFLLWQLAYAELWVTHVYWPDFRRPHLLEALHEYQQRERRFGRINR